MSASTPNAPEWCRDATQGGVALSDRPCASDRAPGDAPTAALTGRRRRAVVALAVVAITLETTLLGLITPLLPEIETRTGGSAAVVGAAMSAYAVPIVAFSIPLGRLADAVGRRPVLIAGLLVLAAGSVALAVAESLGLLIAGRLAQGFGAAASWISVLSVVSDLTARDQRGEALGLALAAANGGAIVGPLLGGFGADLISYQAPFVTAALLATLLAVSAVLVIPADRGRTATAISTWQSLRAAARSRRGGIAVLIILAASAALGLIEVVAPLEVEERLGLSASALGLLFVFPLAANAAASFLGGRWGDRSGRRGVALAGLTAIAASAVVLAATPGVPVLAVALGIYGGGFALAVVAAVPWLDDAIGTDRRGLTFGISNTLYAGGYFVGPALGGVLLDAGGPALSYLFTAALFALGASVLAVAPSVGAE